MSVTNLFSAHIRRRSFWSDLRGNIGTILVALGLAAWGLYFLLGWCSDCPEHRFGSVIIGAGMEAGAGWLIWWVVRAVKERMVPGGDALSAQLKVYGDPAVLGAELDGEFVGQVFRRNRIYLGPRWMVYMRGEVIVRRVDDLVWIYLETIRHKLNGIIPIGTTYQLVVWEKPGRGAAMELSKAKAEEALAALAKMAPWVLIGYTEAIKESWNNDRDDLIAHVQERRKSHW